MQSPSSQNALEWEGGSIDDLVTMLAAPALAVRVEVRTPAAGRPKKVGEIHMVAGGVSEVLAGELRGDDAMDQLRGCSPLSFRLQPRLPNPDDGGLLIPGPSEGTLAERPPAELMRYCELYVLTCVVELWRDTDRASIQYTKGDITRSVVNGSDDADRLPEVMNWSSGGYRLILPELSLPAAAIRTPAPTTTTAAARSEAVPDQRPQGGAAKTMFGYVSTTEEAPLAVQTASASARTTQSRVSDEGEAPHRSTASGLPVDVYDKSEPERVTDVGVPVTAGSHTGTSDTEPAPTRKSTPSEKAVPAMDTLPARNEPAPAADEKADDTSARQPGRAAKADKKPKKKSVKRREARETRQIEAARTRANREERPMTAAKQQPQDEMSLGAYVAIGLALGLGIAAIYWVVQMFGN